MIINNIPKTELQYIAKPDLLWDQLLALPRGALVILDEIQRAPKLLDYAQMGMQKLKHRFLLSGSSTRKIRRGSGNLLGGRAIDLKLHALSLVLYCGRWIAANGRRHVQNSIFSITGLFVHCKVSWAPSLRRLILDFYLKLGLSMKSGESTTIKKNDGI